MMTVDKVKSYIGDIPYMTLDQAKRMTAFIQKHELRSILELGVYHGASTCYLANAVSKVEGGSVTAIDKERSKIMDPNVEDLLEKIGLRSKVTLHYEKTSYLWRLMKFIEDDPTPRFDLCYLDGAHNWFVDGFAFFLVDKLLRPNGWIILDDLDFFYNNSRAMRGTDTLKKMPKEERECHQIRNVYELLIKTHPEYGNFREEENWAYAQKISKKRSEYSRNITTEVIIKEKHIGLGAALIKLGNRLGMR